MIAAVVEKHYLIVRVCVKMNIGNTTELFLDNIVRDNNGRFLSQSETRQLFAFDSKDAGVSGKMYYLVSRAAAQQKFVYFDRAPAIFSRYSDNYDLKYSNHDWSCLLETETVHKFCLDVDCGCSHCKNLPGHTKITEPDIILFIDKLIDYVCGRFQVAAAVMRSSYVVTTGPSHGFHVLFNAFLCDHFAYVQMLNTIVDNVTTHCVIDVPSCFPIGYGRGHVKVKKFVNGRAVDDPVGFDELCPFVDVSRGLEFYHFGFSVSENAQQTPPPGSVKLSEIPVKSKVNNFVENTTTGIARATATPRPDISRVNLQFDRLMRCTDPGEYMSGCYDAFIRPFSLAGHSTFCAQIQQFYSVYNNNNYSVTMDVDPNPPRSPVVTTEFRLDPRDNIAARGMGGDDDGVCDLHVLPDISYEKYITDGVEITNRTGPHFVDTLPEKCKRPPMEVDTSVADDDEENDDIADATDPLQDYDKDPTNNFINIYNLNKYTDPRVYTGHVIDRQYWTGVLENYYAEHVKNKYSMYVFGYAVGIFDLDLARVSSTSENMFGVEDYDHMTHLRPDEIMYMMIVYCMIHGRQVLGVISDLCAASEDYANKIKMKNAAADTSADAEFIDDIDAAPLDQIEGKNRSTWNQICASLIKYSWEYMEIHEGRTGRRFPRKLLIIIKFLYVYNHNTDIAMKNMLSEFTCKHAMVSNMIDAAVSKYMKSENLKFDHHRPYELVQRLTGADVDEGLNIIDFIVIYFWKPFEMTGAVYVYNMKGYIEVTADQFATYVSENCQARKLRSKLITRLDRGEVKPFVQNHARQFIYNTNFENNHHGTYFRNTILGDFENTYGCVQTLLTRKYPNTRYLMGRFKPEIYNTIVDCWNGLQEIDYEIKMSGVKLLFARPVVPMIFETTVPNMRDMFRYNTCALSVKDYRHVLTTADVNAARLCIMYSK